VLLKGQSGGPLVARPLSPNGRAVRLVVLGLFTPVFQTGVHLLGVNFLRVNLLVVAKFFGGVSSD